MTAIIASTRFGPMLVPPYDAYVGPSLIRLGQFSAAEFETWRPYLPIDGVVADVGANIGAHTLAFAAALQMTGAVYAFEPQRALFNMLCGSLALCGARNVRTHHCAVGRESGAVRVPLFDYAAPQNFGGLDLRAVSADAPAESVPVVPLDALALPRLDFMKVDVEGYELDVLHGAKETIARCRPVISAEADREQNSPALLALLKVSGYRVWWHRPPLGPMWPRTVSINLLALPQEREDLPLPLGDVEAVDE